MDTTSDTAIERRKKEREREKKKLSTYVISRPIDYLMKIVSTMV